MVAVVRGFGAFAVTVEKRKSFSWDTVVLVHNPGARQLFILSAEASDACFGGIVCYVKRFGVIKVDGLDAFSGAS